MDWLAYLNGRIAAGRPAALVTVVEGPPEILGRHLLAGPDGPLVSEITDPAVSRALAAYAAEALATGRAGAGQAAGLRAHVEPFLPPPSLVVVGAGHVAQPVAQLGKLLGFHVTVIDDRPEYARRSRFPDSDTVLCDEIVAALRQVDPGPNHYLVLVTRGHRHDMEALRTVIERPVAYIGMIGSRTRVETVFRLLQEEAGIDPAHFRKVYAPIGLDLGAHSPGEIAVSIGAELLKVRSGATGESLSRLGRDKVHRQSSPTPDGGLFSLLQELRAQGGRMALATIIHTRGHCPREVGARMLVERHGPTHGTIGGGCGEAEVRRIALDVIDQGAPQLYMVDLMDDPAVPDGAVCGGKMELFIEPV